MKTLIIKTGHTETFDAHPEHTHIVSLGDVLRTTVLLEVFKNEHVTWFTSKEAALLLSKNQKIKKLTTDFSDIENEHFDLILNLERTDEILEMISHLKTSALLGFSDKNLPDFSSKKMNWSEKLFTLIGKKWTNETYSFDWELPATSSSRLKIGLNWKVGQKWPGKSWPLENWEALEKLLQSDFDISWQEGFHNLSEYIKWISSCDYIVTHDSLGLHLALAMKRPFAALFGPTSSHEIDLAGLGVSVSTQDLAVSTLADIVNLKAHRHE
nr:lipopolysaccharide heptosyltransferase family protein [Bacteriovorax sp. HI3]